MNRILLVEDDEALGNQLVEQLSRAGFDPEWVQDGDAARSLDPEDFAVIILDLMLPGTYGMDLLKIYRRTSEVPILILSARDDTADKVRGLKLGADDYLTKPFYIMELIARVKAIIRRTEITSHSRTDPLPEQIEINGLGIDPVRRSVHVTGQPVELTAREFDLLYYFASHPGRVFSREHLLNMVWGYGHDGYEHTVNSHINRLRKKIEPDPSKARHILTVWGVGYKFSPAQQPQE